MSMWHKIGEGAIAEGHDTHRNIRVKLVRLAERSG
jgi:hypothetical protein